MEDHFLPSLQRYEIKQSPIVKKGSCELGLFLKGTERRMDPSDNVIGVYSGLLSKGKGVYHLSLGKGKNEIIIDGSPDPNHPMTCFGRMNEDINLTYMTRDRTYALKMTAP